MMTPRWIIPTFAVLLVAFTLRPLTSGELWIIDDHEIVAMASQFDSLRPLEFLSRYTAVLGETEFGNPGSLRYRPAYWMLRTLKTGIAGDDAGAWFLLNGIFCLAGTAALGLALGRFFPWQIVLPFMAWTMALPFHRDLWPRLGPAEIDAFAYCMIFCLGASRLGGKSFWPWPCCAVSAALAIGSKENFLLLLPPLGALAAWGLIRKTIRPGRLWWLAFPALAAYPVILVVLRVVARESNLYTQETSVRSLLGGTAAFFASRGFLFCALCLAATLLLHAVARRREQSALLRKLLPVPPRPRDIHYALAACLVLTMLAAGNFVFYSGAIDRTSRYAFPYYFVRIALFLCPLYPLVPSIARACSGRFKSALTVLGLIAIAAAVPFVHKNSAVMGEQIQRTKDFQNVIAEAGKHREVFIINPGLSAAAEEPYFSLLRYAAAGRLPPVRYFPLVVSVESLGVDEFMEYNKGIEEKMRSVIASQPPVELASDVLLLQAAVMEFRKIEHTRDSRGVGELPTASRIHFDGDGTARIASPTVFYVPADDPAITGMTMTGSGGNDPGAWRILVNDRAVDAVSRDGDSFTFALPDMEPGDFQHPQLFKLAFEPERADAPPLLLRSLALLRPPVIPPVSKFP